MGIVCSPLKEKFKSLDKSRGFLHFGLASAGLFYFGRQNVTHSVLCRKSSWRPSLTSHSTPNLNRRWRL
nr:MAG TPA: hypothetical protein [Caudoviricetes sp.]